jgi:hypothetical protein
MIWPSVVGSCNIAKYADWIQTHHATKTALFTVSRTLLVRKSKGGADRLALGTFASGKTSHALFYAKTAMAGFLAKKAPTGPAFATLDALFGTQIDHSVQFVLVAAERLFIWEAKAGEGD